MTGKYTILLFQTGASPQFCYNGSLLSDAAVETLLRKAQPQVRKPTMDAIYDYAFRQARLRQEAEHIL